MSEIKKEDVKKFIPFQTSISILIDVKESNYFKQKILNNILCCLVSIKITINNVKENYYDVGAYRRLGDCGFYYYNKLNYGGLYKSREKAEDEYLNLLKEIEYDLDILG